MFDRDPPTMELIMRTCPKHQTLADDLRLKLDKGTWHLYYICLVNDPVTLKHL